MNELDELSSFRAGAAFGGEPDLARARESLYAEIRGARERSPRSQTRAAARPSPTHRARRRLLPRALPGARRALSPWLAAGAAAAAAAAAVTGGLLTGPGHMPAGHHPTNIAAGPSAATGITVAYVLDHAAAAAAHQRLPRPGQYISLSSIAAWMGAQGGAGGQVTQAWLTTSRRQIWLPASGQTTGALRIDLLGEKRLPWGGTPPRMPGRRSLWRPVPASACPAATPGTYPYLAALPTATAQLREWIYAHPAGGKLPADDQAWKEISDMLTMPLPPKLAAALFHVAATIPGTTVVQHAANATGREGVAVSRLDQAARADEELIFDPASYSFLGERNVLAVPVPGEGPAGTVVASTAVLSVTVTDHLPSHTPAFPQHDPGNSSGANC